MKRKSGDYSKGFRPLTVYLDDIERIVEIMQRAGCKVSVETDEWNLDDVDELEDVSKKCERVSFVQITGHGESGDLENGPSVHVVMGNSDGHVRALSSNAASIGIAHEVAEILRKRQRLSWWLLNPVVAAPVMMSAFFLAKLLGESERDRLLAIGELYLVGCLILGGWAYNLIQARTMIVLKNKRDAPLILSETKMQVLYIVLAAIVGGVATKLIDKFWH